MAEAILSPKLPKRGPVMIRIDLPFHVALAVIKRPK